MLVKVKKALKETCYYNEFGKDFTEYKIISKKNKEG